MTSFCVTRFCNLILQIDNFERLIPFLKKVDASLFIWLFKEVSIISIKCDPKTFHFAVWNIPKCGFSLTRIFPYKDRIVYSLLIRENSWKPVFWHILLSEQYCLELFNTLAMAMFVLFSQVFYTFFYGSRLITYYISICIIICTIKTNTFINKAAAMLCLTLILTLSGNGIIYCTIVLIFFLFPTDWRKANIILVYKRSDKQIWKNTIIQHHYSLFMVK